MKPTVHQHKGLVPHYLTLLGILVIPKRFPFSNPPPNQQAVL